eukprot:4002816-Amphidinium_carterae.1
MEICVFIVGKAKHATARERLEIDLGLYSAGSWHHLSVFWHSAFRSRAYRTDLAKAAAAKLSKQGIGNELVLEDCLQDFIGAIFDATKSVDTAWEPLIAFVSRKKRRSARDVLLRAVGLPVEATPQMEAERVTSVSKPMATSVDGDH